MENYIDSNGKSDSGADLIKVRIHFGCNAEIEGTKIDGNDLRSRSAKFLGTSLKISSTGYIWHHINLIKLGAVYSVLDEIEDHPFDTGQHPDWITMGLFRGGNIGKLTIDIGLVLYSLGADRFAKKMYDQSGMSEADLPAVLFGLRTRLEGDLPTIDFLQGKSTWLPAPALGSGASTLWADRNTVLDDILKGTGLREKRDDETAGIFTAGSGSENLALLFIDGGNGFDATQSVVADEFEECDSVLHEENDEGSLVLGMRLE